MSRIINTEVEVDVVITIHDDAPKDVISRCFTKEWRDSMYTLRDEDEVIEHLAYNAAINGVEDVSRLDGWADVPRGMVKMRAG